jgi:hypothetical protein
MEDTRHPEHDAERLAEWTAYLPTAGPWLEAQLDVRLGGSPESLHTLWAAVIPRLSRARPGAEPTDAELPAWMRWPERRPTHEELSGPTLELLTAVSAYYGELLRRACPEGLVNWTVFRYPPENIAEEGWVVLASTRTQRNGLPRTWVNPIQDLMVMGSRQVRDPLTPGERMVGRNDPARLATIFRTRREELGC